MLRPRIIPCLLLHNGGLVKTVAFNAPKYVGDPINAVRIFNEKEADELLVLDIDASVTGAEPNFKLISQFAAECRMPLCYGGGIKTVEQAKRVTGLGVEKVAISSGAVESSGLIGALAAELGSQSVVVVLDAKKSANGSAYEVWTRNGTNPTGLHVEQAAAAAARAGAGEIVVNSVDNDGKMSGYDLALAERVRRVIGVPLTVLGGAGSLADIGRLFTSCGIVGAAAGSLFVFKGPYRAVLISYPTVAQRDELVRSTGGDAHA
jgi:imidazole glycerol-phosphate synthase subunit HisF